MFAAVVSRLYLRLLSRRRLRFVHMDRVPRDGPLLVVSNHVSNLDPMIFGGYFPRTLFALAKREMYVNRLASWFLAGCNCIPVDRGGGDRRAVTKALEVLRRRGRLLIFVEGTRSRDGAMHRAEPGVGFLARRSGAAILPVAIAGTDSHGETGRGFLARRPATVEFGTPFTLDLAGRHDDGAIADEIAARIAAMLPVDRRGVYASTPPPRESDARPRRRQGVSTGA